MRTEATTLHLCIDDGVASIVFDNPPVNAISAVMMQELHDTLGALRDDQEVRVVVFSSANPAYFLAHVDMAILDQADAVQRLAAAAPEGVNIFQAVGELLRNQPQVTIVKLDGIARGGGAELVAAADMTFASIESGALGQIEALMGIVPSGGGTQYLTERVGRNRALEIVLTGDLYDARTAAAYGWINRALPAADLEGFVNCTARRIADLDDGVASAAKRVIAPEAPMVGYRQEERAWSALLAGPSARARIATALERGAQTPDGERELEQILRSIPAR